ncbi:Penicillin-binding protein PbpB [compost metagenome]
MPTTAWVKKARPRDPVWHPGETLSVAIGQGAVAATALQQAVMVARLANGRKSITPRLIKSIGGKEQPSGGDVPDLPFSDEHLDIVRAGMAAVANDVTGTAYRASQLGLGDIKMAGKTGTAQSRDYGTGSRGPRDAIWTRRDHGLFVAFAPHDAPRYAIALTIQHAPSGGSADAAPRAREVMKVVLLKDPDMRARIERPLPPEPTGPISEDEANFGAAPEAPVEAAPPARAPRTASTGPRPYLSEPR